MTVRPDVARAVRVARAQRDWTQQQLADASGVSRQTIHRIESEVVEVGIDTLGQIAGACGVTIQVLLDLGAEPVEAAAR
jgi:transcriptional regulator with XRE-family HTH domain